MTIHLPLLLLSLTAPGRAPAQAAPTRAAKDAARVQRAISDSGAAYRKLRSYSGRFQRTNRYQPTNPVEVQSGEIRWALPNRLWMRTQIKSNGKTYSRRAVSDGRFVYTTDSRVGGGFTKRPIGGASGVSDIATMILAVEPRWTMDMAWIMAGLDPLDSPAIVRITSPPSSPTLAMELRHRITSLQGSEAGIITLSDPMKMTFLFGASKLLRETTSQHPAPDNTRSTEKHWDIRLNPTLPATLFRFKPAPGARQVERLEPPGPTQALLSQP